MSPRPGLRRLVIGGAVAALSSSLMVGGVAAAESGGDLTVPPGASAPLEPSKAGGVQAQTTVEQGATRRDANIATQNQLADGTPASLQINGTQATQDLVGQRLVAVSSYRATPEPSAVYTFFGVKKSGGCIRQAAIVGAPDGTAQGNVFDANGNGPTGSFGVTSSLSGSTITVVSAASALFRDADWDCAWTVVGNAAGTGVQQFLAADLVTTYVPKLALSTNPVQGSGAGRWTTVKIDVANTGRADATGVTLRASGSGLTFNKKSVSLGTIGARSTTYGVAVKVKLKGSKQRKATFTITSAGGHSSRVQVTIARKPKATTPKTLSGRSYWGNDRSDTRKGWDQRGITFLNKKWAYVGFSKNGSMSCRKTSKTCKRYSYKGGRVKIAGQKRVKVTSEGFKLKGVDYSPLSTPKKNAKLTVSLHNQDFRGCGANLYCSTYTETLSMGRNGRFVLTTMGISSIGVPGVGTITSRVGPDERGRYQVLSKGRIRFVYDDGRRVTKPIGIELDIRGKANASAAGVVIGGVNYYRPRF